MDSMYMIIVGIMMTLAITGLVVGVANDAVNFLNSALGSKVAPRYVIMTVASVGIIVGAITSSGMMEVARSGVFHPEMFSFSEVMMLFLAVMFMNVILLDVFDDRFAGVRIAGRGRERIGLQDHAQRPAHDGGPGHVYQYG